MFDLVVLADDLTGALDTGVQLAKAGIATEVTTVVGSTACRNQNAPSVLVVDMESRHLPPDQARQLAKNAAELEAMYYYKKTDSGLRGNIGAELEGLLVANPGHCIAFVPAFPEAGRTTSNGVHYVAGVPVSKSIFGEDPFEPVTKDYIPDIIAQQSTKTVTVVPSNRLNEAEKLSKENDILVFDAIDSNEMQRVAEKLTLMGSPRLMAGCAGFARYLPHVLGMTARPFQKKRTSSSGVVVLSGSINRITMSQVLHAQQCGFTVIEPTPEDKLTENLVDTPRGELLMQQIADAYQHAHRVIVQSALTAEHVIETDDLARQKGMKSSLTRRRIAANLGDIAARIARSDMDATLAVFGGDTLIAVAESVGGGRLIPVEEIVNGVVLSTVNHRGRSMPLITKSGGFGDEDILKTIEEYLNLAPNEQT